MTEATHMAIPNEPEDELARLATAAKEALTDSMVERLAVTGSNLLEVADRLNDEDTREAIDTAINRLTELHQLGALDTLFDVVTVVHGARNALTDAMVERLFVLAETMINGLATEEVAALAHNAYRAMEEAVEETATRPTEGGLFATLQLLRKPETQKALQFMLAFSCKMQQRATNQHGPTEPGD
jgi:uncharacterized protein YjgD (DUF1641 family)